MREFGEVGLIMASVSVASVVPLIKVICDRLGCMEYEDLLEELGVDCVENVLEISDMFTVIEQNKGKKILLTSKIRLCKAPGCRETCTDLHLCKFQVLGQCNTQGCKYGHSLTKKHNSRVLHEHGLQDLSRDQLRVLLLQNDSSLLPNVCVSYNKGSGHFGNCPDKEVCVRLHVCEKYIRDLCNGSECNRSHDFHEPHPAQTLQARGVSNQLIVSLLQIYQNILILKDHRNAWDNPGARGRENPKAQRNRVTEICLWFIGGNCKHGDKCQRVHCGFPYKWQVEVDEVWIDLPDNEVIERDYCDPAKIHSVGGEPVCFDTMMQGVHRVRRLSTQSSVIESQFSLTTKWSWYWENEYNKWIQYGSIKEMHRLSSITSEYLEKKYLHFLMDNSYDMVRFTAGQQCYELNFRAMKQRNEFSSTERAVRRRPRFVSLFDVRAARTRRGPNFSSRTGVPGFWDKTAIPKSGYQLVPLDSSHKDYVRVQEQFNKTMKDFSILSIKRVQNKKLWEDFQTKRERIKKANSQKKYGEAERLLFHRTNSKNVDAICRQNFDTKVSGANATMYGQGTYFARDAKYSSDYTDHYGESVMFACRVLIGQYTKGASHYRSRPDKDADGNLYDSCVNDVRNPTIYVVFERSLVYPEFLITYKKTRLPKDIQSSIFGDVSQTARSVTSSHYEANVTSSDSSSTEKALYSVRMPSSLVSPLNPVSQRDDEMMMSMTECLNVFHAAPESEQSVHSKPIPSLTFVSRMLKVSDQGLSTSVTNPVSSTSDNPLIAVKPSLTDNSIQSKNAKDQPKTATLWTSNISTERMSQKLQNSAPLRSPEFNKSMSDPLDPISCSSDKAKLFDASSTTCLSEMESKTTMPCKSHALSLGDGSWTESFVSGSPEKESCTSKLSQGSLSSTGLSRKPAEDSLTSEKVPVSSHSDHQLPISDKTSATERSLPFNLTSKPELVIPQRSLQKDRAACNFSHPLSSTSTCSPARNLSSDSPMTYTPSSSSADKRSTSDGSLSSFSVSFHERQPPSSALSSTPLNSASPQQASQQRKDLGAQKNKCSLQ